MKRLRGSGTHNSPMNRDQRQPRPNLTHAASGKRHGILHAPPSPGVAINSANYGGQRVMKRK
jgi:hypothetical protein